MLRVFNQKGFAALEAILIVVIVAIIGGTGYYVWHAQHKTAQTYSSASQAATTKSDSTAGPVTQKKYHSIYTGAMFSYPSNWQAQRAQNNASTKQDGILIKSPSGDVSLSWDSNILGVGAPPCTDTVPPGAKGPAPENNPGCPAWTKVSLISLPYGHGLSIVSGYATTDNKTYSPLIAIQAADSNLVNSTRTDGLFSFYSYKNFRSDLAAAPIQTKTFASPDAAVNYLQTNAEMQAALKIIESLTYQ